MWRDPKKGRQTQIDTEKGRKTEGRRKTHKETLNEVRAKERQLGFACTQT